MSARYVDSLEAARDTDIRQIEMLNKHWCQMAALLGRLISHWDCAEPIWPDDPLAQQVREIHKQVTEEWP